ncbi:hypothetical protein RIF25_10685 [Thermosynechococcaceae cyanobacterium BACA0444]|uniref:Uncharacterized protein n=1 Tax=Pseudocalidococcus azoricus BACA0444 TaxID=2918990 RepID=A0AAE4FU78_9CYAN|nr:hypothetical protein [Pseudocalidococcus azoricus]MDS3861272.1 hypothetical protein [Pseudocalidococcus azoricus BACA0444]
MEDVDGYLLKCTQAPAIGRRRLLLHINGVTSDQDRQYRDLKQLAQLTQANPLDMYGIHNQTHGFEADLLESLLGKAELYRYWPGEMTPEAAQRLQAYGQLLNALCVQDLAPDADMVGIAKTLLPGKLTLPLSEQNLSSLQAVLQLPFIQKMGWLEFANYIYGTLPPGAPRPTLRLAYEILRGIQAGAEIFIVAHSQGLIITALACRMVEIVLKGSPKWAEMLRIVGYGPVILWADLPAVLHQQTVLIQHRQDLVAESLSNMRQMGVWNNVQAQLQNLLNNSDGLFKAMERDSHHAASNYLGLQDNLTSQRSSKLIQLLLTENWQTSPWISGLAGNRIILEAEV